MWVAFVDFIAVYDATLSSSSEIKMVDLTEGTSYRRMRLCCQFYEHNNYLTNDAAKD